MVPYRLTYDPRVGVIELTIVRQVLDHEAIRLAGEMAALVAEARTVGPVHILQDLREAPALSPRARARLVDNMNTLRQPGDRIAIVLTTCVRKVKAGPMMADHTRSFVSHAAALTWLNAWTQVPAVQRPAALAG